MTDRVGEGPKAATEHCPHVQGGYCAECFAKRGEGQAGPSTPDDLTHYMQACSRLRESLRASEAALADMTDAKEALEREKTARMLEQADTLLELATMTKEREELTNVACRLHQPVLRASSRSKHETGIDTGCPFCREGVVAQEGLKQIRVLERQLGESAEKVFSLTVDLESSRAEATKAERERCAKIAERMEAEDTALLRAGEVRRSIAATIRADPGPPFWEAGAPCFGRAVDIIGSAPESLAAIRAPQPPEPAGMLEHDWNAAGICTRCGRNREDEGIRGCNPTRPSSPPPPTHNCGWLSRFRCGCSICEMTKCLACIGAERDPSLDAPAHSRLCDWTAAHGRLRAHDGCVPGCPAVPSPEPTREEPRR